MSEDKLLNKEGLVETIEEDWHSKGNVTSKNCYRCINCGL